MRALEPAREWQRVHGWGTHSLRRHTRAGPQDRGRRERCRESQHRLEARARAPRHARQRRHGGLRRTAKRLCVLQRVGRAAAGGLPAPPRPRPVRLLCSRGWRLSPPCSRCLCKPPLLTRCKCAAGYQPAAASGQPARATLRPHDHRGESAARVNVRPTLQLRRARAHGRRL